MPTPTCGKVIIGCSHGAGTYGMCSRAFDPRFLFTWCEQHLVKRFHRVPLDLFTLAHGGWLSGWRGALTKVRRHRPNARISAMGGAQVTCNTVAADLDYSCRSKSKKLFSSHILRVFYARRVVEL